MLAPGLHIYVEFPNGPDNEPLSRGVIVGLHDGGCTAQMEGSLLSVDPAVRVHFRDAEDRFMQVPALIEDVTGTPQQPLIRLAYSGEIMHVEQRASFRVSVADDEIFADVDAYKACRVFDISPECFTVALPQPLQVNELVTVTMKYTEQSDAGVGKATVRSVRQTKTGLYRHGLRVLGSDSAFRQWLLSATMIAQRNQLRRRVLFDAEVCDPSDSDEAPGDVTNTPVDVTVEQADEQVAMSAVQMIDDDPNAQAPDNEAHAEAAEADSAGSSITGESTANDGQGGDARVPVGGGRRRHERQPWQIEARIRLYEDKSGRHLSGMTGDLSRGGFSVYVDSYVYVGTRVETEFQIDGEIRRVSGIVKHCHLVEAPTHFIGVELTSSNVQQPKPNSAA